MVWISSGALFSSGRTLCERSGGYVVVYLATPSPGYPNIRKEAYVCNHDKFKNDSFKFFCLLIDWMLSL